MNNETVLASQASNGFGNGVNVSSAKNIDLALSTTDNANMVIIVYGSIQEQEPNWNSPVNAGNEYSPIGIYDLNSASSIVGSTGIVVNGTDINKLYQVNVDGIIWINLQVNNRTSGTVNAIVKEFNNK